MDIFFEPWPWYVAGPCITIIMVLLLFFDGRFGVSSNLETLCTIAGAGKKFDYFRIDWRKNIWNIIFILGSVFGGFIAHKFLVKENTVGISAQTKQDLLDLGIQQPGHGLIPSDIFNWENLMTWQGFVLIIVGGFLIGFGTRYAKGCTSGHAISGLSNLQLPSLIAVIGFFIGGIIATYFLLPLICR